MSEKAANIIFLTDLEVNVIRYLLETEKRHIESIIESAKKINPDAVINSDSLLCFNNILEKTKCS